MVSIVGSQFLNACMYLSTVAIFAELNTMIIVYILRYRDVGSNNSVSEIYHSSVRDLLFEDGINGRVR